ncbi:MAG: TerD family protein [Fusobacteriaceae bacterium]
MNYNLVLGENKVLNSNIVTIKINWKNKINKEGIVVGIIDRNQKITNEKKCIFLNKQNSAKNEIISNNETEMIFKFDLNIYTTEDKIKFFLGFENEKISEFGEIKVEVKSENDTFEFFIGNNNSQSIEIFEIYSYKNFWKIKFTGMVDENNILDIFSSYGIDLKNIGFNKKVETKINFNKSKKIILEKGQKLTLVKQTKELGSINVNLNWNTELDTKKGILNNLFKNKKTETVDLDLGCFVEFKNGEKRVIQALGNSFGNFENFPYVVLDKDDRTGENTDGENLFINGSKLREIKKILIYTFIYEGTARWEGLNGVVTIKRKDEQDIIINLDGNPGNKNDYMCALLLLENKNNETFEIQKLVKYFTGHENLDKAYNWNFKWSVGSKD